MGKWNKGKWIVFGLLVLLGLIAGFLMPGYQFSGMIFLCLSALIPVYHILGLWPKYGRWAKRVLSICIVIGLVLMSVTLGIIVRSAKGTQDPDAEYLVVLGAGVNGTVPSRSLRERLEAARDYLLTHPEAVAIVSGGQGSGEQITEAECMFRWLTAAGIDEDRVWKEDQAKRTIENLNLSLELIEGRTGKKPEKIAIVSSEYHLHRANMFAQRLGLEAQLIPAKTEVLPLRWNYYLREIFGVWYYTVFGGRT